MLWRGCRWAKHQELPRADALITSPHFWEKAMRTGVRALLYVAPIIAVLGPMLAMAKELPGLSTPTKQSDWNFKDREAWNTFRKDPLGGSLPGAGAAARRFYEAFKVNLKAGAAAEYQNIMQRHAFYDAMSFTLHRAKDVDKSLRCIRFFDAAADVTATTSLGAAENVLGEYFAGFDEATRKTILAINEMLFAKNVGVMKTMMELERPFDPTTAARSPMNDAITFDLKMVQFEQGAIEDFLATRPNFRTSTIIKQLSSPPAPAIIVGHAAFGPGGTVARWSMFKRNWLPAVGITNFSFELIDHRIAMGEAYVFFLHKHGVAEYKSYKANKIVPSSSCFGVIP